ncbi:MAG: ATP-binding protein [Flavobacteriaceae bacterium]|nr:ATP-binding protein [Flavobacteriaceae bacterium]
MITRHLETVLTEKLFQNKAIILMGSRQVGKTTLLRKLFPKNDYTLWMNGDELDIQKLFETISADRFKAIIGNKTIVIIDEAQRIHDIGLRLKLIKDSLPDIQIIATGSSSFELTNRVNEPLTGRKWEYLMYPLSFSEMVKHHGLLAEKRLMPHRLLYGYYPEVVNQQGNEKEVLKQLSDSYLYKDVLMLDAVKKPEKIVKLLQALALQLGSQVSYNELGNLCGLDSKTIEKYIQLLEKTFVVFKLSSFSRNVRNELKNSKKIYFYDNGIRNALIANFNQVENRTDAGALWENFLVSERIKHLAYNQKWVNNWFWRTKDQKELDYIEEADGQINAYEFKWNTKAKAKIPKQFTTYYPDAEVEIINPSNFDTFLL